MNKILILIALVITSSATNAQWTGFEQNIIIQTNGIAGIYACDIDNDGDIDIVVGETQHNRISLFRNAGSNQFQWTNQIIGYPFNGASSVYCADFDGDGFKDIVGVARRGAEVAWWRNPGNDTSSWNKQTIRGGYYFPHEVYSCDFDSDGDMDVFVANSGLSCMNWWRNDGGDPIVWVEQTIASGFSQAKSIRTADIDGDGDLDVVGAAFLSDAVKWWRNDGGNPITWTEFLINGNFDGAHKVNLVDIDKDGRIDVLGVAYWGGEIAWWRNDGGNPVTWSKQIIATGFAGVCEALAADLDNDGNLDVVGTAQVGNELALWRNGGGSPIVWTKYVIDNLPYSWPLFVIDMDSNGRQDIISAGAYGEYPVTSSLKWYRNVPPTDVNEVSSTPEGFYLYQNYPNPFNPTTKISYQILEPSFVTLKVYDMLGNEIKTLVNEEKPAGSYGVEFNGRELPSGIYVYKIQAGFFSQTKKMILLK
jgi:hypothetical protein